MTQISPQNQANLIQRKPYVALYFTKSAESSPFSLEERQAVKEGPAITTVFYKTAHKILALSSRYGPQKEAEQMLTSANKGKSQWRKGEIIFILGMGNIAILSKILPLLKAKQICIAIDASLDLGKILCQQSPLMREFLARPGCHLFCGTKLIEEGLRRYLESLPLDSFSGMRIISHAPSLRLTPKFYGQTETLIQDLIKIRISDMLTRLEFEDLWVKNILLNTCYLPEKSHPQAKRYTVKNYKKALRGMPGVLVASGPSLQESFAELKLLKERAFVLCVDSALKVLLQAKIVPHAVMSLDAQSYTYFSFMGLDLSEIIFFADLVSNPLVLRKAKAQKVIFSTTAQVRHTFEAETQFEYTRGTEFAQEIHGEIGYLQSGGSVATSAFDLLRLLGCDPILLVGLDQAYTGRQTHSNGSYYTDACLADISRIQSLADTIENIIRKRKTFFVPAMKGGSIRSDHVLNLYRYWFQDSVRRCSQKVYQLTRKGALLDSALTVEDPLEWAKKLSPRKKIADALQKEAPRLSYFLHPKLKELIAELKRTIRKEISIAALYEQFPFLQFASRKAELYIERNQDKLEAKRAKNIVRIKTLDRLKRLERSLRHVLPS